MKRKDRGRKERSISAKNRLKTIGGKKDWDPSPVTLPEDVPFNEKNYKTITQQYSEKSIGMRKPSGVRIKKKKFKTSLMSRNTSSERKLYNNPSMGEFVKNGLN